MSIRDKIRSVQATVARHPALLAPLRPLTHLRLVPQWVWKRMPVAFRFQVAVPGGQPLRYRSHARDSIGRTLYWKGVLGYEEETTAVFVELARFARCFLDIGAHTGFFGLLACALNPQCEVHCFEPVPHVFDALRANIELNGFQHRCHAVMAAVSNQDGTTKFHIPRCGFPLSASLHPGGFRGSAGELVDVRVVSIDRHLGDRAPVDLIKIDTEGFEDAVLRGMPRILQKHHPDLIVECIPGGPHREVERILRGYGYRFAHLRASGPTERPSIEPDLKENYRNYLCVARESTVASSLKDGREAA